jgi:hypothetical protein
MPQAWPTSATASSGNPVGVAFLLNSERQPAPLFLSGVDRCCSSLHATRRRCTWRWFSGGAECVPSRCVVVGGAPVRAFRMPSGDRYWTVIDGRYEVHQVADAFLRELQIWRDRAESTSKAYAEVSRCTVRWRLAAGRESECAASDLGLFTTWLTHQPAAGSRLIPVRVLSPFGVSDASVASWSPSAGSAMRTQLTHTGQLLLARACAGTPRLHRRSGVTPCSR